MKTDPLPDHFFVDTDQMIEVDRLMIGAYRIELVQMMENAGRSLALLARDRFLDGDPRKRTVTILAGPGGNGGGALVCARRLHNWGAAVQVLLSRAPADFSPVPSHQLDILERMGLSILPAHHAEALPSPDLIIDGLIGYSLKGPPREPAAALIEWANGQKAPTLSLDAPSGVDTTTGTVYHPAVRAAATLTLALPKTGLLAPGVEKHVGELYLADISVPPELYTRPGLELPAEPIFATSEILRLR